MVGRAHTPKHPTWAHLFSSMVRLKTKFVNFEFLKGLSSQYSHSAHEKRIFKPLVMQNKIVIIIGYYFRPIFYIW